MIAAEAEAARSVVETAFVSAAGIIAAVAALVAAIRAGSAKESADTSAAAATEAADLSRPTGHEYAEESRRAWQRVEAGLHQNARAINRLADAHERTRDALLDHLGAHASQAVTSLRRPDRP